MSFLAVPLEFSKPFLKICKWVLFIMSLNCKLSGIKGRLLTNSKMRKAKEPLKGSNGGWKWKRLLLFLWVFLVATGFSWFLFGFVSTQKLEISRTSEDNSSGLIQQFNVSKDHLHELASSFFESDQITSLKCTKQLEHETAEKNVITCALEVPYLENHGLEKQKYVESREKCCICDENIPTKGDSSISSDSSVPLFSQSLPSIASKLQSTTENTMQTMALGKFIIEHFHGLQYCFMRVCLWAIFAMGLSYQISGLHRKLWKKRKRKVHRKKDKVEGSSRGAGKWMKKLLVLFVLAGVAVSIWLFWYLSSGISFRRKETLASMCDERARMLQDQFNVSMNHVHALAILVSTFYHGKEPAAIDQKTFGEYTERTSFERPLTSGVAYALRVRHPEREKFEKKHGWTIKKMETEDQTLAQDCDPEKLDASPIQDEYAPVILSQETVAHIVSIDMMSGKEDRENILRARASGKGVLTSPFKLLKSNHLGVVLTFAVYNTHIPQDATSEQRINATVGYLGASYDIPSLVEKLLHQLASKQTIVVNVYDTTNISADINMYGPNETDTGLLHISSLDFGDPARKHEMRCRFKNRPSTPWTAIAASAGQLIIVLLLGHIFYAAINRIDTVERDYQEMMELKHRAEAADVAKSQFLATVSHEIRTPMNGVLGMLQMLMDTNLNAKQLDFAQTAHASGKDLIKLINEVLDQAKIESGKLELEAVPFDLRTILDNVLSLFSTKSQEKGIELAVYVSDQLPKVVVGDPGRLRQIITNLVSNSLKFTHDRGHIFVSVHLADEVRRPLDMKDEVLKKTLASVQNSLNSIVVYNTLSGLPVVDRRKSWGSFEKLSGTDSIDQSENIKILVTVEDTGVGIPKDAQSRIFMPFMQADSSTSRTYGGTGIGLSISKRLVGLMNGEIGFVSEPGTGSAFSFTTVFMKKETSSLDTVLQQQYYPSISEFDGLRALVIDQKSIRAEVTRYHLQRMGIFVEIASSLYSAQSYISSDSANLDMILIDEEVYSHESDLALFLGLKELRPTDSTNIAGIVPKIFLLANSKSPARHNELKSANLVSDVLVKPLRFSVLISCFQETLITEDRTQVTRRKPPTLGTLLCEKKILVVDDNVVNRRVAEGALKKYGAIVTCVDSGKAALEMLKPPHFFDACFMDLQMPEMDGFEATKQIRSLENKVNEEIQSGEVAVEMFANVAHWHTPILAMTADVIQATDEKCMKCGMDGYVSKPFEEEQLYTAAACFFESG
ncbi:histidine kinase 2 [Cynara cardunculus var. scolymus]|uniref:histidine kinase 2 n=1 Tax=Cynara cardunculus var. scolymus TaxID=59895 RepID=UPI000D62F728|nr:histidine kinase 2 [Cynara cardunculus var. scolymus]